MTNWPPLKSTLKRPHYRSLMSAIETAINSGTLKPGERLPTHRELSYQLGLSVQTVSRAYARLVEAGQIVGEVGRGSFVRHAEGDDPLPFPSQRVMHGTLDLALLRPVVGDMHKTAMKTVLRNLARDLPEDLLSSFRASTLVNRHAAIMENWLALCGLKSQNLVVIPTNGNTSAMTVALMSVARSGDLIVTEKMGHHTLPALCRSLGLRLTGLEVDEQGILPSALDTACQTDTVKALYVMSNSGITANTMSEERRRALVAVARRHEISIVENDGWGPLSPSGLPPMAALAPERCFYFTSLTKCIVPGLRVGFLVAPRHVSTLVEERHMVTNWTATPLMLEIAAHWIREGTAFSLLEWQRNALMVRAQIARDVLNDFNIQVAPSCLMAWLPCADIGSEARLVEGARNLNIHIAPGSTFSIGPLSSKPGARISLGTKSPGELRRGLEIIGGLLS